MSVVLAKRLQILEIRHLKSNSLGDFFVINNATGGPVALLITVNYFLSSIQLSFLESYHD